MNKQIKRVVINTVRKTNLPIVQTIYHVDALLHNKKLIEIACPSAAILDQLNRLRPEYVLTYKIAE